MRYDLALTLATTIKCSDTLRLRCVEVHIYAGHIGWPANKSIWNRYKEIRTTDGQSQMALLLVFSCQAHVY